MGYCKIGKVVKELEVVLDKKGFNNSTSASQQEKAALEKLIAQLKEKLKVNVSLESEKEGTELNNPTAFSSFSDIYPGIKLTDLIAKYGEDKILEAQIAAISNKLDKDTYVFSNVYVDLLEKTTFMNDTISKVAKANKLSWEDAKSKLAEDLGNYENKKTVYIKNLWNRILAFFSKHHKNNMLLNAQIAVLSKRFREGVNSSAIRLTPKEGFSKVDTEKTFINQPFAASVLKDVMKNSGEEGEIQFTGSAALALQGDIYRKGKDGITDLHDLDIIVNSSDSIEAIKNELKKDYSIQSIYNFSLPTASKVREVLDLLGSIVPKSLIGNVKPAILNKYMETTRIDTSIVTPKGTEVVNLKRYGSYKYSRVISYEIKDKETGKIVGTYKADVVPVKNSSRTEIIGETTTGEKAVVLDLIENKNAESGVPYTSPNVGKVVLKAPHLIFDAKNSLGLIPRDKDVLDFSSFYSEPVDKNYGNLKDRFSGKVILANSGIGKSFAVSRNSNIVDSDTILATILGTSVSDIPKKLSKSNRNEVYKELAEAIKKFTKLGRTVVTPSTHPEIVKIADFSVLQDDHYVTQRNSGSGLRDNVIQRNMYSAEKSISLFKENTKKVKNQILLGPNEFLSDVLFEVDTLPEEDNVDTTYIKSFNNKDIEVDNATLSMLVSPNECM